MAVNVLKAVYAVCACASADPSVLLLSDSFFRFWLISDVLAVFFRCHHPTFPSHILAIPWLLFSRFSPSD
jgi:hypothetical protein